MIVAQAGEGGAYYAAYPTTEKRLNNADNRYLQIARLLGDAKEIGNSDITFKAVSGGQTAVTIGDTRYYINVIGIEEKEIILKEGECTRVLVDDYKVDEEELKKADHKIAVMTVETLADESGKEVVIRGISEGTTSVLVGATRCNITVEEAEQNIKLKPEESIVVSGGITAEPDDSEIATATETSKTHYTKVENVNEIKDAGEYLIVPVLKTTHGVSKNDSEKTPVGFALEEMGDDLSSFYWRILVNGDGTYSIQDPSTGKYMRLEGNTATLGSIQKMQIVPLSNNGHNGFGIKVGGTYLNCHGGVDNDNAAAYEGNDGASTWYLYKRETTITGVNVGVTDVVINNITYHVTVKGTEEVDVVMNLGSKKSFQGAFVSNTNEAAVSTIETDKYPYIEETEIVSGEKYLIVSGNKGAFVNSETATAENSTGLGFVKPVNFENTNYNDYGWTFTLVDGTTNQYYVQNGEGKYLNIVAQGNVTLTEVEEGQTPPSITLTKHANGGFLLRSNSATSIYLNNHGGINNNTCATGWGDQNSNWYLYGVPTGTRTIVTANALGKSDVVIGDIIYHITVQEPPATYLEMVYLAKGDTVTKENKGIYSSHIEVADGYDESVVNVELTDSGTANSVAFTALEAGKTIVDVGPTRYYVYVGQAAPDSVVSEEEVEIYVGQTKAFVSRENGTLPYEWEEGYDTYLEECSVYGVNQDLMAVRGNSGNIVNHGGIGRYYVGDKIDLSDCLYTFTATDDGKYFVTAKNASGTKVYVNHHDAGVGKAHTTAEGSIKLESAGNNLFYLNDINGTTNRNLYFHKDGTNKLNLYTAGHDCCKFALYRPATAAEMKAGTDNTLPGYVQVSEVVDGAQYLIVTSYEMNGVNYHYAIYPTTSTGENDQTVQIVPNVVTGNKYSEVRFTGKKATEKDETITLTVDTKTYHITVKELPKVLDVESTPFVSKMSRISGQELTRIVLSANNTYTIGIGNGYLSEDMTISIQNENGTVANWATINANGVISAANTANYETTYDGYVVAETTGGYKFKIPLRITPCPKATSLRLHDIYLEDFYHTDVYYAWLYQSRDTEGNVVTYPTTLEQAVEGQIIYVSTDKTLVSAIDFFAEPETGYALTQMGATGSQGHYKRLVGENVKDIEFCLPTEAYKNNVNDHRHPAGYQQYYRVSAEATIQLINQVRTEKLFCDGAQGFTRYENDGDVPTNLSYRSEKLPTVEKKVRGILGVSGMEDTYRPYVEGMAVVEGEYIYFDVIVTTYDTEDVINYEDNSVILTDIMEKEIAVGDTPNGAEFYEKDGTMQPTNENGTNVKDITDEIKADGLAMKGNVHTYNVVYQVTKEDIDKVIADPNVTSLVNHVDLEYTYWTEYSSGIYGGSAEAEAEILLASTKLDDIVVDFGLPVTIETITADVYYNETGNTPLKTAYGEVTVDVSEEQNQDNEGSSVGYRNKITYTPTQMLEGMDTVTLMNNAGDVQVFQVYPASTVYYEEGFAEYTGSWGTAASKGSKKQSVQYIGVSDKDAAPYGFDNAYMSEENGPSNGTEAVSTTAGQRAEFAFTGSGVDIYANCQGKDHPTGTISVLARNAETNAIEKLVIMATKVGGAGAATAGQNNMENAYNLPVVSLNLAHGEHLVTIGHSKTQEEVEAGTTYPVKLDGFRVYNTLSKQSIYQAHQEENPVFLEMRNAVLGAINLSAVLPKPLKDENGEVIIENGKVKYPDGASIYVEDIAKGLAQIYDAEEASGGAVQEMHAYIINNDVTDNLYTSSAQDLLDNSPKNELFLYPGETLVFNLVAGLKNVQIGMKAVNSEVSVAVQLGAAEATTKTIKTSTDMFYRLGDITEATTVRITNVSASGKVLSITELKHFATAATGGKVLNSLSAMDFVPMLKGMGYVENPDSNEPTVEPVTDVFTDVKENAWYVDAVQYVYDANIMTGNGDLFTPNNPMTRAQMVATLYRLAGSPEVTDYSACDKFTDAQKGAWYIDALCWAYNTNVTTGNSPTTFGVKEPVTREQFATFLYRYANNQGLDTNAVGDLTTMENADKVSAYAQEAMKWVVGAGLISGSEKTDADGNVVYDLAPKATATRAQMATILMRFCGEYDL